MTGGLQAGDEQRQVAERHFVKDDGQASRARRLRQAGFGENELARLHAPVGLNIGAKSPAEIAVSIMAQITARLRNAGQ